MAKNTLDVNTDLESTMPKGSDSLTALAKDDDYETTGLRGRKNKLDLRKKQKNDDHNPVRFVDVRNEQIYLMTKKYMLMTSTGAMLKFKAGDRISDVYIVNELKSSGAPITMFTSEVIRCPNCHYAWEKEPDNSLE